MHAWVQGLWRRVRALCPAVVMFGAAACVVAAEADAIGAAAAQVELGDALARHAMHHPDPLLLLAALRLLRDSAVHGSPARSAGASGDGGASGRLPSRQDLLSLAVRLAAGRPELSALIADEAASIVRGTPGGLRMERAVVRGRQQEEIRLSFQAGLPAGFGLLSDRLEELALEVLDEEDRALCLPQRFGRELRCHWLSGSDADVRIRMINRGERPNVLTFFHD